MHRRIGIYPGSFDPIHPGHIAFAKETLKLCRLDEVIFLPEQEPRGKHTVTGISHRIALIRQVCQTTTVLRVARVRSRQFTTEQTLPELHEMFGPADFTLLIGSDIVRTFTYRWDGLKELFTEFSLAIGMRASETTDGIGVTMRQLSEAYAIPIRYQVLSTAEPTASSSQIRNGNLQLLSPETRAYIQRHQLYIPPAYRIVQ